LGFEKWIYDEVHGYIPVTKAELDVIDTPIFQRLHNIRQLGTAYTVFPGATHTRFAHSLGVMRIVDELVTARGLKKHISMDERKKLRMAALLHDVGHYPLSHVIEVVMTDHGKSQEGKHEENSARVITKYLAERLTKNAFDPKELSQMIRGKSLEPLHNQLLSSELDADRMDYLLRDSHNTGVRYGAYDIDRLVHSLVLDRDGRLAVQYKGKHAAENYMIARYHMYLSVYSHKVVMGFAELVQHAYDGLVKLRRAHDLQKLKRLSPEQFSSFDDNYLFSRLREVGHRGYFSELVKMIMGRDPLEVAFEANMMMSGNMVNRQFYDADQLQDANRLKEVAKESGIPDEWIFHSSTKTQLSSLQLSYASFGVEREKTKEMSEAIHIVDDKGKSRPLIAETTSLTHYINQLSLGTVRIYTSKKYKSRLEKFLTAEFANR